ncbi:hypothetical protein V5P93_001064 [Actinokineospora auranticolor]|uniref:hypothetical protein n=1 Tax=Actinokineospora auranticolor TaxID=155976 RepID=UPI0011B038A6|nr:hypothetical protein [Actinokineospora auranticolor]
MHRLAAGAAASVALVALAVPALAQADPEYPVEVGQPTLATAVSVCDGGKSGVEVILDDRDEPYTVRLTGSALPAQKSTYDDEHGVNRVLFTPVPVGSYTVEIEGADEKSDGLPVTVKPCKDLDPAKGELNVSVACRGGWGVATFEIANPATGDVRNYTLQINNPYAYNVEVAAGVFLSITDNLYDDGEYVATLRGDGFETPLVRKFTVKCASDKAPGVGTYALCDSKPDVTSPAQLWVELDNPNRAAVEYSVTANSLTKKVSVPGASHGNVNLGGIPAGDYPVVVKGSDGTEAVTGVSVDHCADVKVDRDGLQVATRCVDDASVVTVRFYAVGPYPSERKFSIEGTPRFDATVRFDGDGVYRWTRHVGLFEDGVYTAHLTGGGLDTTEKFTVDCAKDTPQPTTTVSTPDTTTTPKPTEPSQPQESTPAVTTSAAPVPPGDGGTSPDGGLPVTGVAVGGMVLLGLAALGGGTALLIVVRRRRAAGQG